MSSQKGNVNKAGPPKYQNKWGFKNTMNDKSQKTKEINKIVLEGLCSDCKTVIDWKINYKKYKRLTTPSKCVKCLEKKVTRAYYLLCQDCSIEHNTCSKCIKNKEIIIPYGNSKANIALNKELEDKIQLLHERDRRTIRRKQERDKDSDVIKLLSEVNHKLQLNDEAQEDDEEDEEVEEGSDDNTH